MILSINAIIFLLMRVINNVVLSCEIVDKKLKLNVANLYFRDQSASFRRKLIYFLK